MDDGGVIAEQEPAAVRGFEGFTPGDGGGGREFEGLAQGFGGVGPSGVVGEADEEAALFTEGDGVAVFERQNTKEAALGAGGDGAPGGGLGGVFGVWVWGGEFANPEARVGSGEEGAGGGKGEVADGDGLGELFVFPAFGGGCVGDCAPFTAEPPGAFVIGEGGDGLVDFGADKLPFGAEVFAPK